MRKVIYIAIVAAVAIFCLQGLWIGNMYRAYIVQAVGTMENAMSVSIGKEIAFRRHVSPYKDPKHPKIVYKKAEDMTPEERSRLKGDTLDLELLPRQHIGSNLSEVLIQIDQDDFIEKGKYVLLILIVSALLMMMVLGCVIYLVILVRKKDKLFKQREASVNGTVHDLKAPLNSVITLMDHTNKWCISMAMVWG